MVATMTNTLFTEKSLGVLLRPESWRIIGSRIDPEVEPVPELAEREEVSANLHKHAYREIMFALDGPGNYGALGGVYPSLPGAVFLFDKFEEHQNSYPSHYPDVDHLWIFLFEDHVIFRLILVREKGSNLIGPWTRLLPMRKVGSRIAERIFGGQAACGLPDDFRRLETHTGLTALASAIVKEGYSAPGEDDKEPFQKRVIATIRDHVRKTAGSGASLDSLARMSGYSKFYFLRLFREHTGMCVHEYIDCCRLERVRKMQECGCYKKEIAAELGFSSLSAFSRWYRHARLRQ